MISRNSVCAIFHAMCLTVMGMLPASAFADNPMVIHEVKTRSLPAATRCRSSASIRSIGRAATSALPTEDWAGDHHLPAGFGG